MRVRMLAQQTPRCLFPNECCGDAFPAGTAA
jgi:hypothetical protein